MPQVLEVAKRILDKWSRMFCGISTSFYDAGRFGDDDDDGAPQDQYKSLRKNIERIRQSAQANLDDDEDEETGRRRKERPQLTAAQKQAQEVQRGVHGIIMPARNAFDFVEKPQAGEDLDMRARGTGFEVSKGHEKIKKVMNGIKRMSKTSFVNRRMQTVKADM